MKILAINGSHKKTGGVNQLLIDSILKGARSQGAECETIRLSTTKIETCLSCDYCQKKDEYTCVYDNKDDFQHVYKKLLEADILIFSTPVYIFNISGLMKTFLDRIYSRGKCDVHTITQSKLLFHDVEERLANKKFISIIVSDNIESKTTKSISYFFRCFASFLDYKYIGNIVRNGSYIFRSKTNSRNKEQVSEIIKNLEIAGRKIISGKIPANIERKINKRIIPLPNFVFNLLKRSEPGRIKLLEKISTAK